MLDAIENAHSEIYLETYIFYPDEVGRRVIDALKKAAARGVQVHVIIDWLGTGRKLSVAEPGSFRQPVSSAMYSTGGFAGDLCVCTGKSALSTI